MAMTTAPATMPMDMPRIERLREDVVNRIAAGEVIHRPANALKELLENSLDAGATQVSVTVGQGGLKMLQIQDNGKGIVRDDLPIVCERFTTSKLRAFEDLREIRSFGFRGEALASISHVAHVTITSKTAEQQCAFRAMYRDGKLAAKKPGGSPDPMPCAGKNGTQILVEDLFYNLPTRRQALKNASEQYQRILDVVQRYAIHYGSQQIGFVCKKHRDGSCDVNTLGVQSQLDAIRRIFGSKLANELVEFEFEQGDASDSDDAEFTAHAWISNANFHQKTSQFILFINHRLVHSGPLKRALEYVYSLYLPKHTHPFIYLSVEMPPRNLDVNVHPTKHEVHFLYEEVIVESLAKALEARLKDCNQSRVFVVQPITSLLPPSQNTPKQKASVSGPSSSGESKEDTGAIESGEMSNADESDTEQSESQPDRSSGAVELNLSQRSIPSSRKYNPAKAPQKLVRTDPRSNTMDRFCFLDSQQSSQDPPSLQLGSCWTDGSAGDEHPRQSARRASPSASPESDAEVAHKTKKRRISEASASARSTSSDAEPESEEDAQVEQDRDNDATQLPQMLTSVQNLLGRVRRRTSSALEKLFREHSFVGVVNRQYSLLQFRTKLYLVRHRDIAQHVFYQRALQLFGKCRVLQLPQPLSIRELILEAVSSPRSGYDAEDGPPDQLADEIQQFMATKGPMLAEYFGMDIDAQGNLRTLPRLLEDHEPSLHSLPEFILELATDVNWEEEEACFDDVALCLAHWYSELWYPMQPEQSALVLEHVLFPATKQAGTGATAMTSTSASALSGQVARFSPPQDLNDTSVLRPIACLTRLYRIFERC